MKIIVISSNKYANLLNGFANQFNKYWPGMEVIALCYNKPKINLPSNFEVISVGIDDTYWTNLLIPFFLEITDDHLIVFLEDHFIVHPVDQNLLKSALNEIVSKRVSKVLLGEDAHQSNWKKYDDKFLEWMPTSLNCYAPVSLTPSIWTKNIFLEFLQPNWTASEFESKNIKKSIKMGFKTIKTNNFPICLDVDVCRNGSFNKRILEIKDNMITLGKKQYYIDDLDINSLYSAYEKR